jgi:hypothetical protein
MKFKESPDNHAELLQAYGEETAKLVADRTKTSQPESKLPAAQGAIREQKNKFRSLCGMVPSLNESMFDALVYSAIPDFRNWEQEAKKLKDSPSKQDDYRGKGRKYNNKRR